MTEPDDEYFGPVDYLVASVPSGASADEGLRALLDLVDTHAIRILDVEVFASAPDGVSEVPDTEWADALGAVAGELVGARSGLLDAEDRKAVAAGLGDDSVAVVVVYESLITLPVVSAFRAGGAHVLDGGPLGADEIAAALGEVEES